jgi:DNA-directed RNA polymerase specialized sigma24 family protein
VAALPYAQRVVLVLRYWADLADADIARTLDVRPATVRSMAHRATRRLQKDLIR